MIRGLGCKASPCVQDEYCTPRVQSRLITNAASACATRDNGGTCAAHVALESQVAAFLGKEACMILGMGYATNSAVLPALFRCRFLAADIIGCFATNSAVLPALFRCRFLAVLEYLVRWCPLF